MSRLNKMKILKPLLLYKHDLFDIENLLRKHLGAGNYGFDITPMDHGQKLAGTPFHSMDELFHTANLPARVRQITIEAKETSPDQELLRDAKVSVGKFSANVRVVSKDNEQWVNETFKDLSEYFESKKAWYWLAARVIPPIFNTSMAITFMLTMLALLTKVYAAFVFPIILASSAITMLILNLTGRVYSFTRVNLINEDEEHRFKHEKYVIWVYFGIVLSCIAGAVASTWHVLTG